MSKGLAPAMLRVVYADDLDRVDGPEKGGRRKCIEKDRHARGHLRHLNRQGPSFSHRVGSDLHAAKPFAVAISVSPCSRLQTPGDAGGHLRLAALRIIARLSVSAGRPPESEP